MQTAPRFQRRVVRGAGVVALAALCVAAGGRHPKDAGTEVAVFLDLTGGQAGIGRPAMNGFVLGLQQAGETGPVPFAALIDTRTDPELARAAASDVVARVTVGTGFTDSDALLAAGPLFQRAKVPFLAVGATDPALPEKIGDRVFLTPFGDNTQAAAGAEFAVDAWGRSAAILWDATTDYTRTLPRYFRTRFEQLGGQVALDLSYDGGCDVGEPGAQVAALPAAPAFVYLAGLPDCIGDVVASLRAAGVSQPILGGDGLDTPALTGDGSAATDVWFTTHAWLSEETGSPEAKHFIEDYRAAYGQAPPDAFAALGYDAARLILDALGRVGKHRTKDLQAALEETRGFSGVTGSISFSRDSHVPQKTVWVIGVQAGVPSLAAAIVPQSVPPPIVDN